MASAIWGSGSTCSAAPSSAAALGMPQTTLVASSWAMVFQPRRRSASNPWAPSRPMPVRSTATPGLGQFRATLSKEHVDRWPVAERSRLGRVMQPLVRSQDQVIVGAGEKDLSLGHGHLLGDQLDLPSCLLAEPLAEPRGEGGVDVLDDHDRGLQGRREPGEDLRQRERAAGRRAQHDERMKAWFPRLPGNQCRKRS